MHSACIRNSLKRTGSVVGTTDGRSRVAGAMNFEMEEDDYAVRETRFLGTGAEDEKSQQLQVSEVGVTCSRRVLRDHIQ